MFRTCHLFQSQLKFVVSEYNQWRINKYKRISNYLSGHEALDLADGSVHCFPGAVVGLWYHSDVPEGYTMREFRQFLRETYGLQTKSLQEMEKG
ncbi:hypothetical protein NL676_027401 [Syzygium grande]|nr:hypothetical protein NL676_027401 [Syzygium grande]